MSAGLNVKAVGRDRLLFRTELAARVRWSQPDRVVIDLQGARTAVPMSFPGAKALSGFAQLVPIPYFAGSERLMWWMNLDGDEDDDGDDEHPFAYVHPLDERAEHVYQYRSGETATIRLPGGRDIVLREVIVTARETAPDLINGSLWFDSGDGQLVRAAFRPASPLDMMKFIGEDSFEDVPAPAPEWPDRRSLVGQRDRPGRPPLGCRHRVLPARWSAHGLVKDDFVTSIDLHQLHFDDL